MDRDKFGKFISELRKEKGMTQQELGDKLHITNKAISKWERGLSFPDICLLTDISLVLDVSVLELLNGEKNTEEGMSNEVANKIVENTVNHSRDIIKKTRKKFTIIIGIIIGMLPILVILFSIGCINVIKDEKSIDEAILTFAFIILAAVIVFVMYGIPILGIVFTRLWQRSSLEEGNQKNKKVICSVLYGIFGLWLLASFSRILYNLIVW